MTNRFLTLYLMVLLLGCSSTGAPEERDPAREAPRFRFFWQSDPVQQELPSSFATVHNLLESERPMLALYREDLTHQAVTDFFVHLTGDPATALPMLYYAEKADLSLSLIFSLVWVESRFSPVAVNENATSIDRGLFQLNSLTFRHLSEEDFFDIPVNTWHGIDFLLWCLSHTDSEYQAVAVYNAGLTRVRAGRTPASTLVYVERIREYRRSLEKRFRQYILNEFPFDAA
ncbi:Transglycosylase SLT domain-containing protein [Alkalispirochaeta americana]|uniref:Transglycosylase SLT domain-containing protein n=1 Tax=Alkalispirochaeta americana TaxID=159291 RepID=A0A1N6TWT7_9SPIO|nr:lytic transglycosylase domain-containing protein [Alkalispirochaeta americana]SIQ57784.1 Transglycosylase SLT domain-containing protein [Alkalispirochaeta americana]